MTDKASAGWGEETAHSIARGPQVIATGGAEGGNTHTHTRAMFPSVYLGLLLLPLFLILILSHLLWSESVVGFCLRFSTSSTLFITAICSLYCQLLTKLCCCAVLSVRSKPGVKNLIIHIFFSFLQSLLQTHLPIKRKHGFPHLMLEVFSYLSVTKNISQLSHFCLFNPLKTALESEFIW